MVSELLVARSVGLSVVIEQPARRASDPVAVGAAFGLLQLAEFVLEPWALQPAAWPAAAAVWPAVRSRRLHEDRQ